MKLRVGWIVEVDGKPHRVAMVNQSRARVEPIARRIVTVIPHLDPDKKVSFEAALGSLNISPYSDVPVLAKSLDQFHAERVASPRGPTTGDNQHKEPMTTETTETPTETMKTNKTSTKPARTSRVDRAVDKAAKNTPGNKPLKVPKAKAPKATGDKPLSKCAYIDSLYTGEFTQDEILKHTLKKFPDADPKGTLSTVKARPGHMRAAGKDPKWVTPTNTEDKATKREKATA